jgi:hypothetical protein
MLEGIRSNGRIGLAMRIIAHLSCKLMACSFLFMRCEMISKKRIAELEAEKKAFFESPKGKALIDKLNKAYLDSIGLSIGANEDDWIEKAIEFLSPKELKEFIENVPIQGWVNFLVLRHRTHRAKLKKIYKIRQSYGPQVSTEIKLQALRKYRREFFLNHCQEFPKIQSACKNSDMPISYKTVKSNDLELIQRWKDPSYDIS